MNELEEFLKKIVSEAGKKLLFFFKREKSLFSLRGTSKQIVTKYDKLIDKFLIEKIKLKFPRDGILTEESGWAKKNLNSFWIIDSLDGSGNFANGNPLFSVNVAYIFKKEIILGAIFAPALHEFYFAKKGKGAFLNGKRIKVSKIDSLKKSYVVYCDGNEKNRKRISKILAKIYPKVTELRKIGSAGIETAWVASGRVDAYFTMKIDPWDVAAGILLVREAGGEVSDFFGKDWQIKRSDLLFSNKLTHEKIKNLLKNF
jgi:myo-inositol-1(or 4)-monophosphatase